MEILGLLDHLETMICDSVKIPLINRTLVDEEALLAVVDKIKMVLQDKEYVGRNLGGQKPEPKTPLETLETARPENLSEDPETRAAQILQQAYQVAKEIREGADKYADDVLVNLEATADRILRTVRNGRQRLGKGADAQVSPAMAQIRDLTTKEEDNNVLPLREDSKRNIIKAGRHK